MIIYFSRRWGYVGTRVEESKKKHLVLENRYWKVLVLRTFQTSELICVKTFGLEWNGNEWFWLNKSILDVRLYIVQSCVSVKGTVSGVDAASQFW